MRTTKRCTADWLQLRFRQPVSATFGEKMMRKTSINFLWRPSIFISVFVAFKAIQAIEAYRQNNISTIYQTVFPIEVLLSALAGFMAIKGNKVAKWALGLYMLTAIVGVPLGIIMPVHQYVLKPVFIVLGLYFPCGGWLLIREAWKSGQAAPNPGLQADAPQAPRP